MTREERRRALMFRLEDDGQTPVPMDDARAWASWFETADRVLAQTSVPGGVVSTVFLGLDHNYAGAGRPLLWETMVFLDGVDVAQDRYETYAEAVAGHTVFVARYQR